MERVYCLTSPQWAGVEIGFCTNSNGWKGLWNRYHAGGGDDLEVAVFDCTDCRNTAQMLHGQLRRYRHSAGWYSKACVPEFYELCAVLCHDSGPCERHVHVQEGKKRKRPGQSNAKT